MLDWKYIKASLDNPSNITTGRVNNNRVVRFDKPTPLSTRSTQSSASIAAPSPKATPVGQNENRIPNLNQLVTDFQQGLYSTYLRERDKGSPRRLNDFNPSRVYRKWDNAQPRKEGLVANVMKKVQSDSTYQPVETYGFRPDKPGDYVIAFGGASTGEGADNDIWTKKMLDERYGENAWALFTPQQIPQAIMFAKALPKGSRIHVTGHSQGGGAAAKFLKGIKGMPDDFVHSVHLYDAVSDNPFRKFEYDFPFKDRTKHFVPGMWVPADSTDYWAYLGGRAGKIKGVRNFPVSDNHRYIWASRGDNEIDPQYAHEEYTGPLTFPLARTPLSKLSNYDFMTMNDKNPVKTVPARSVMTAYNPVTDEREAGFNVNGTYDVARTGVSAAPVFNLANPSSFLRRMGIQEGTSLRSFYRDKAADAALSSDIADNRLSPFTKDFLSVVRNVTSRENPSVVTELLAGRNPDVIEAPLRKRIEFEFQNLFEHQNPQYARQGFGPLLQRLQLDINKMYSGAQMSYLRGDGKSAVGQVRAAVLAQIMLGEVTDSLRKNMAFPSLLPRGGWRTVKAPSLYTQVRNALSAYYMQKNHRSK